MEFIIDNYGKAILIFLVVVALAGVLTFLLRTDGVVATAFQKLINDFFTSVSP